MSRPLVTDWSSCLEEIQKSGGRREMVQMHKKSCNKYKIWNGRNTRSGLQTCTYTCSCHWSHWPHIGNPAWVARGGEWWRWYHSLCKNGLVNVKKSFSGFLICFSKKFIKYRLCENYFSEGKIIILADHKIWVRPGGRWWCRGRGGGRAQRLSSPNLLQILSDVNILQCKYFAIVNMVYLNTFVAGIKIL